MGVKLVIFNDADPGIAVTLTCVPQGAPGVARGWHGECTQCGKPVHYWTEEKALKHAQEHVDGHEPELLGGDRDALVRS